MATRNAGGFSFTWPMAGLALLAAVALAGTSRAADAEWLRLEADGFVFTGDVSEKRLQAIASELRMFRYAIGRYITSTPSGEAMPVSVMAVTRQTWERHLRPRERIAGLFVPGPFSGDILVNGEDGWENARTIVFHEYTHYYVHNLDKFPYPAWFNEGLAQFLAPTIKEGRQLVLGRMPYGNWLATGPDAWIPTARLVQVDLQSPEYRDHNGKSQFYPQSWLFAHYLLVGNPAMLDGLNGFLGGMVNGADPAATVQASFGMTFEQLDATLQAYYRRQNFRVIPIPAPPALAKVKTRAVPIAPAAALRDLGLAALRGQPDDANRVVPLFTAALEADPGDARAMAGLALALAATGKGAEASRWMSAAASAPRADAVTLRLCGDFHAASHEGVAGEPGAAAACYKRAVAADPGDYDALVGLAGVDDSPSAADNRAMIAALEAALRRYPQSEFLGYALARAHFIDGNVEAARATLVRAANVTRNPAMRQQMAVLLRELAGAR